MLTVELSYTVSLRERESKLLNLTFASAATHKIKIFLVPLQDHFFNHFWIVYDFAKFSSHHSFTLTENYLKRTFA